MLLSKLPFPWFGKLYLTDTEEESSSAGWFGLLHVADITLLIRGVFKIKMWSLVRNE